MTIHYLETRGRIRMISANMMADVMRHFHARQHLGKAVVLCDDPVEMLGIAGKQWQRLSRLLQRQRGTETDAVEILKYTHTITQMQHLQFVAAAPHEQPEASIYFVKPLQLRALPANCLSVYVTARLGDEVITRLVPELPTRALLVDYLAQIETGDFGLKAKTALEDGAAAAWCTVEAFLSKYGVEVTRLLDPRSQSEAFDDAIDELLGADAEFLGIASQFQRALDLARPLRTIPKSQRDRYEVFMLLAHRVQTLSSSAFSPHFLNTYADDTFFLNDIWLPEEDVAGAIERHTQAGRSRLVQALLQSEGTREAMASQ